MTERGVAFVERSLAIVEDETSNVDEAAKAKMKVRGQRPEVRGWGLGVRKDHVFFPNP